MKCAQISGCPALGNKFFALAALLGLLLSSCERVDQGAEDEAAAGGAAEPSATEVSPLADVADTVPPPPPDPEPVKMPPVINKDAEVSILGYHDFTDGSRRTSDMVIDIGNFREQMQLVKDSGLPVISMQEYLAWRREEVSIPDQCVMITIDDGWKDTHTLALPVLREFGYPFTLFLYQKYVGIGGRSLTHDEVREIMAGGGAVGSHSVSHQSMIDRKGRSQDEYDEWMQMELDGSFQFLKENFGKDGEVLRVFAYPFGIYSDEVVEQAISYGYEAAFTVNGKKTRWDTGPFEIGRYIVYGEGDQNFSAAMAFRGGGVLSSGKKLMVANSGEGGEEGPRGPLVKAFPEDGASITERRPVISLDVSKLVGVDPDSITVRVTGFGEVKHSFDVGTGMIRYQVPMSLRMTQCGVMVRLRHEGNDKAEEIAWNFSIDRVGSYLEGVDPEFLSDDSSGSGEKKPNKSKSKNEKKIEGVL